MSESWTINSEQSLANFKAHLDSLFAEKKYVQVKWKTGKAYTQPQHNSIFLFCEMAAQACNDAGLDMRAMLKQDVEIPWTKESFRNQVWNVMMEAMYDKKSVKELNRDEVSMIYEVINRHLGDKHGLFVEFPNREAA